MAWTIMPMQLSTRQKWIADMPSFDMASKSVDRLQWLETMKKELQTLLDQHTWPELDRTSVTSSGTKAHILPRTSSSRGDWMELC